MQASPVARVIISISAMLFAGFAMTRITKRFRLVIRESPSGSACPM